MMLFRKVSLLLLPVVTLMLMQSAAWAAPKVNIGIKTILASDSNGHDDPRLKGIIDELRSVFRFTSYRLLDQDRLTLAVGKTGTVKLPGNRVLKVTPTGIRGKRAQMKLSITRKNQQIFNTQIELLNKGTVTVGGPRHENGYLLLNISGRF